MIRQIVEWPDPIPYLTVDLKVLGYQFHVDVPAFLKEHVAPNSIELLAQ
jgi:hypothetical protein